MGAKIKLKGGYVIDEDKKSADKDDDEEEEEEVEAMDEEEEEDEDEEEEEDEDEEDESEEKETLKFSGSAPVDKRCPWYGSAEVLESDGSVWDAMLNQTNIGSNNNKFYVLQVLKKGASYGFWTRWGRVGVAGQDALRIVSKDEAIKSFKKKFKDKTKNNWDDRADFVKYDK